MRREPGRFPCCGMLEELELARARAMGAMERGDNTELTRAQAESLSKTGLADCGQRGYENPVKTGWTIVIALLLVADGFAVWMWLESRRELEVDPLVHEAAMKYHVQPALIKAVIWQESRYDADARGLAGEVGLMQIMKAAALDWAKAERIERFNHENLFHPGSNTLAGAWYLRKALERYTHTDNNLPYALAEYNAGRGNVLRWIDGAAETNSYRFIQQIEFPGTQNYVRSVMTKYAEYLPEYGVPSRPRPQTAAAE